MILVAQTLRSNAPGSYRITESRESRSTVCRGRLMDAVPVIVHRFTTRECVGETAN